jgi:hypothetical protein
MPVTKYSKDTKKMLDDMMKTSGLPLSEQRKLRAAAAAGPSARMHPAARKPTTVQPYDDLLRGIPIRPNMGLPGTRRTQQQILASHGGSLERDQFRGGPLAADRAQQKLALQQQMEFGRALPDIPIATAEAPPQPQPSRQSAEASLRSAIVGEIEERRQFLDAMSAAGKFEHETAVKAQISERMHDLERLDKLSQ